jgi:hypothetical protein
MSSVQKDDLTRMDLARVRFLPRRMYENYLLVLAAVATVMNGIAGFRERAASPYSSAADIESAAPGKNPSRTRLIKARA